MNAKSAMQPAASASARRKGQGWCMPPAIRRFGEKLLAQQLWCWGRDIEAAEKNLLLRFGFERYRDNETEFRSTCYRLDQERLHVSMWGFGIFYGCRELGGLFLDRFGFCPDWAPIESISMEIHWPDELPIFGRPYGPYQWQNARKLWASMLLWISDYEKWVWETQGGDYRQACVASWLRPFVRADRMSQAWRYLSRRGWESQDCFRDQLKRYKLPTGKQ